MNRLYAVVVAASTFVATSFLVGHADRGLSRGEMNALRGGSPQGAKHEGWCDVEAGVYVGCKNAEPSSICFQCAHPDEQGAAKADVIGDPDVDHPGGYEHKQDSQDCGTRWMGYCVADSSSPTGFACVATNTGLVCTHGVFVVGKQ